jgi:hypothetical protein
MNKVVNIASFDIDGVINLGYYPGVYPGPRDIIITGRSYEEEPETLKMLMLKGINNDVFFNPLPFEQKTRESSGIHKANTIRNFNEKNLDKIQIVCHFEDDPIQVEIIRSMLPEFKVFYLEQDVTEKENVRHYV